MNDYERQPAACKIEWNNVGAAICRPYFYAYIADVIGLCYFCDIFVKPIDYYYINVKI